ncbi:B-cell linker protein isoform X3 [Protopterus annectens]|uniref:B-cell linker protein isoform X3 n=1 Tax=Protopterus annectens TaxID=7888 RepID=UPI001CF95A76|nr:B-cell linker protein isoform X3 [Protopterus annectens]
MATKLPLRDDFETWTPYQVADFLIQNGLNDCAAVAIKYKIHGADFLNLTQYGLDKFNVLHQPKLQKIVSDIKKNDGGLLRKFKQIKVKVPPSVPSRDYPPDARPEHHEPNEWSDDEEDSQDDYEHPDGQSDSEMYQCPEEGNYEPPPTGPVKRQGIQLPVFNNSKAEYADKKPAVEKSAYSFMPPVPGGYQPEFAHRHLGHENLKENTDDDDYIVPENDDNYIDPVEDNSSSKPPNVNRREKPSHAKSHSSPAKAKPLPPEPSAEVYEVPDKEEESPPSVTRKMFTGHKSSPMSEKRGPTSYAKENNRVIPPSKPTRPKHEQKRYDEYEVSDQDNVSSASSEESISATKPVAPKPHPRPRVQPGMNMHFPKPPKPLQKPTLFPNNEELSAITERRRGSGVGQEAPPPPPVPNTAPKPPSINTLPVTQSPIRPPEVPSRPAATLPRNNIPSSTSSTEKDSGVYRKVWYASSCSRKVAEDALNKSSKDGSFLIRKSSGQDPQQPYTLVVLYNRRVYNIPIRYIDTTDQYALGREKSGEDRFGSVAEMVEYHQQNALVLIDSQNNTKDSTKLKYPVQVSQSK